MNTPTPFEWTDRNVADLKQGWADWHSCSVIGARLGCSKSAIISKVHRLNLPSRSTVVTLPMGPRNPPSPPRGQRRDLKPPRPGRINGLVAGTPDRIFSADDRAIANERRRERRLADDADDLPEMPRRDDLIITPQIKLAAANFIAWRRINASRRALAGIYGARA